MCLVIVGIIWIIIPVYQTIMFLWKEDNIHDSITAFNDWTFGMFGRLSLSYKASIFLIPAMIMAYLIENTPPTDD